jgi:phosphoribosyl-ATP pyrophosphohydrolase
MMLASEHSSSASVGPVLEELYTVITRRKQERPENAYTTYLFNEGLDKILRKVGEEATETIVAAKNDAKKPLLAEVSDLLYHLLVLLVERNVALEELKSRRR